MAEGIDFPEFQNCQHNHHYVCDSIKDRERRPPNGTRVKWVRRGWQICGAPHCVDNGVRETGYENKKGLGLGLRSRFVGKAVYFGE